MTLEEALVGATINAAASLDRADRVGSLEPGKQMDAVIIDGTLADLVRVGAPVVRRVVKRGRARDHRCATDQRLTASWPRWLECRMPRFADLLVTQFLDALASPEPTPGGGTAAAVAGAIGTSLLMMVAGLREDAHQHRREERGAARRGARRARSAFGIACSRWPTPTPRHTIRSWPPTGCPSRPTMRRRRASRPFSSALRAATEAPLETLRAAARGDDAARGRSPAYGNRSAASDVRVALELLEAAAAGAAANVEINLVALDDEALRKATAAGHRSS